MSYTELRLSAAIFLIPYNNFKRDGHFHRFIAEDEKLRQDLEKVEQLESKIKTELSDLQSKIEQMNEDMVVYQNTDEQKTEAEALKQVCLAIRSRCL